METKDYTEKSRENRSESFRNENIILGNINKNFERKIKTLKNSIEIPERYLCYASCDL